MTDAEVNLLELHKILTRCHQSDATFAIGQATGVVSKAQGLVGRDIDELRAV